MPDDVPSVSDALSTPDTIRALHDGRAPLRSADDEEAPADDHKQDAQEWLGDLTLLKGVPFLYLVPDDRSLPQNALRFFHVDPNWVRALLEGAMSVGRDTEADTAHDAVFGDDLKAAAGRAAATIRARLFGQAPPDPDRAAEAQDDAPDGERSIPPMSGFLLRSRVVSDWPGLRAKGKGTPPGADTVDTLRLLRLEQLSDTVLIGLFRGRLTKLRLGRAVETLHFGLRREDEHWAVGLHDPKTGAPEGKTLSATGAMRNQGDDRVVQAGALAQKLAGHFGESAFTSAEYSLQMVQSTREVVFTVPSSSTTEGDATSDVS